MPILYTIFAWFVVSPWLAGSPGVPKSDNKAGQNLCHKNVVKCVFWCTVCGNVDTNVNRHSNKNTVISLTLVHLEKQKRLINLAKKTKIENRAVDLGLPRSIELTH